jgi:hypothetical protein
MAMSQKQKTLSTLAVVAAVVAALASYAWFGVYQKGVAEQKAKDEKNTVFSFKKDDVKKIAVTAKGDTTVIVRDGADWKITAPIQTRADKMPVDAIVDKLTGLKRKRGIDSPSDLKEYGLTAPRIKVAVTLADGKTAELDVGDDNGYDGTLFTKTGEGNDVDVCEGALKYPLDKSLFDLREKRVFEFDDNVLSNLDVVGPKLTYSLVRSSASDWKISAPVQERADSAKAQQLAASLKNLKATRFATEVASADDLKRYGLDHAAFTVNVTLGKQETQKTLVLASVKEGAADKVYVKRAADAWIAEVPNSIVKDLDLSIMDLRDKTILDFKQEDAVSLLFSVGPNLTFGADRHRTKTDGGFGPDSWTMSAPAVGDAKRWKASSVLSSLETIKGASIVVDGPTPAQLHEYGLDQPAKTVTVIGEGGRILSKLLVGKTDKSKVYVKSEASPRVYEVDSFRLAQLPSNVTDLMEVAGQDGGATATAQAPPMPPHRPPMPPRRPPNHP